MFSRRPDRCVLHESRLSLAVKRSARRRELANTMDDRWSSTRSDDLFLDVGPDRTGLRGGRFGAVVRRRDPQFGHVLDGNTDREVEGLGGRRCHDPDGCRTGEEPPDLLVRTDSGRQSDALRRTLEQAVQAFQ